jgi:tetratricopeptide (TPR) repeat protein
MTASLRRRFHRAVLAVLFVGLLPLSAQGQSAVPGSDLDLGTIDFPTSATGEAQTEFLTGVLALHSFWYPEARDHFRRAQTLDPQFAMAYWGEAMTHDHPLWDQHDNAAGRAIFTRMDSVQGASGLTWSARERSYVEALRTLYTGEGDIEARRNAYATAMQQLATQYPDDDEAAAFSALAQMSVEDFDLDDAEDVVPIAAQLEELYERHDQHPGILHYLIHVYDSETFAPLGLRPARTYAEVAPASSHALHMPSHIFRQLEQWERVVASNQDAYQASVDWQQRTNRPLHMRDYHSYSWLMDAYLALDRFEDACGLIQELESIIATAEDRGEDVGRMPSLRDRFTEQYDSATEGTSAAGSCAVAQ